MSGPVTLPPSSASTRAKLRKLFESGLADDGDGVVGRKVVAVVFEDDQMQRVDDAVGGIARDDVDFVVLQRAVDQAEVHDAGLLGEMQAVTLAPALEAVGALEKFEADADSPLGERYGTMSEVRCRCRRWASSPRMTMAKVFSKPSGSVTAKLKRWP